MLCAPLDWQHAELPSSASDAVLCTVLVYVRCGSSNHNNNNKKNLQGLNVAKDNSAKRNSMLKKVSAEES